MKTKAFILILVFLGITNLIADECGYSDNFKEISCPEKEKYEKTLTDVSFIKGTYTCKYAKDKNDIFYATKKIKCLSEIEKQTSDLTADNDGKNGKFDEYIHKFARQVFSDDSKVSDHFVGSTDFYTKLNTAKIYDNVQEVSKKDKDGNIVEIRFPKIDSHTKTENTLGAIITGVFTLDPEFFKNGYIDSNGRLTLNESHKAMQLTNVKDKTLIETIVSWVTFSDTSAVKAGEAEQYDVLSFMDRQVLGYLVYFGIAVKKAYMDIVYYIFGLGLFWSVSFYSYKKFGALSEKKDEFNINKTSWLMGASMAMVFFMAPIVKDGDMTPELRNAVYLSDTAKEASDAAGVGVDTYWSTPAQQTLRYFLQLGNYFGNLGSDYGMYAFLRLVSYKQGMFNGTEQMVASSEEEIRQINDKKIKLGADINFYNTICRNYFSIPYGSLMKGTKVSGNKSRFYPDTNSVLLNSEIKAERLSYNACLKLESEIYQETNSLVIKIDTLNETVESFGTLYQEDSEARANFQRYIDTMVFSQNNFGWIEAPIVPISYFFFKNADYFAYNSKILDEDKSKNVFASAVTNFSNNDKKRGAWESVGESTMEKTIAASSYMITSSFWFVIPGFSNVYEGIEKNLSKLYIGQVDIYNALISKKTEKKGLVTKIFRKILAFSKKTLRKFGGYGKVVAILLPSVGNKTKSAWVGLLISIVSIFIAAAIFTLTIEAISIVAIAIFLAIKITLFLVEILIFYFASPAIGLFYAMMNNQQSKNFVGVYFQNVGILALTPILLTVTTFLIIVVSEFLRFFFLGIINLFISLLNKGSQDLYSSSEAGITSLINKVLTMSMINGVASIFVYFAVLVVATVMIFNFRDWYTKFIGIDSAMNIMKESGNEIKQSVNKYVNPVG